MGVAASSVRSNSRKPRWLNSRLRPRPRLQSSSQKSIRRRRRRKLADPTPPLFAPADTTTTAALLERQSRIRHARNFGPRSAIPAPPRLWDIVGLPPLPDTLSLSLAHFPPFWCQKGREGTPGNVAGTKHTFSVREKNFLACNYCSLANFWGATISHAGLATLFFLCWEKGTEKKTVNFPSFSFSFSLSNWGGGTQSLSLPRFPLGPRDRTEEKPGEGTRESERKERGVGGKKNIVLRRPLLGPSVGPPLSRKPLGDSSPPPFLPLLLLHV